MFLDTRRVVTAPCRTLALRTAVIGAFENEAIHAVEQIAGELEHLLRSGGKLRGTGCGLLNEPAHLVHGANNGLGSGSLLFDGGIDFLGDLGEASGRLCDLGGTDGLLVR